MRIGILSDTHDRVDATIAALAALRQRNVAVHLHCGDIGSERILDHFAGLNAHFVTGNTDWDRQGLIRYGQAIGLSGHHPMADLTFDARRFAILHGDDHRLLKQLLAGQEYDYLLHGHTHVRDDRRVGRTHLINPGALHRAVPRTVAVLDTETDQVEFLLIPTER